MFVFLWLPYKSKEHPWPNEGEEEKNVNVSPLHVEKSVENIRQKPPPPVKTFQDEEQNLSPG